MLTKVEHDRMRAAHMEMLYQLSGRTNGLYTGLWDEYKEKAASLARELWWEEQQLKNAGSSNK